MTARARGKAATGRRTGGASRHRDKPAVSGWRWYAAGLLSGVFLSFLLYLGTLAPEHTTPTAGAPENPALDSSTPKPRFDFYTVLPEQSIEVEVDPAEVARARSHGDNGGTELYLLQAGSFRNPEDADRRRGELLLLGLEPRVEQSDGDNGRWYRVFVGPFDSRSKVARARSMTAAEGIDTLLLKRGPSN